MRRMFGLFLILVFGGLVQAQGGFSNIPSFFSSSGIVITSNPQDRMAASLLLNTLQKEDLRIQETIEDEGNLIIIGGPRANPLSERYGIIFGIEIFEDENSVSIKSEGKSISHSKQDKDEDIAIAYMGKAEGRNILLLWGYGRKGTYAACLHFSNKENWREGHLLLMSWEDRNKDEIVSPSEIETAEKEEEPKEETISVTLVIDYGTRQDVINARIKKGATVLDLLRQETQVDYTIYPFGVFITSISGLANDNARGYYWLYWTNGVYASMAADAFLLQEGDVVEWKYKKP